MPLLGMYIDPIFLVITLIGGAISMFASARVKSTFNKYARVGVQARITGAEAAQRVLDAAGVRGVRIEPHQGFLTDHYDPRAKALRLSPDVFAGQSISAIAVAAHEAGHAIQDKEQYAPLVWRSKLVPATNLGSRLWMIPFMLGLMTQGAFGTKLIYVAIGLFSLVVLFQLVTLPTEFDASKRARTRLAAAGITATAEVEQGVAKVLNAAAMTYVAAALTAVMQLLYLLMRAQSRD